MVVGIACVHRISIGIINVLITNEELSVVELAPANESATVPLPAICTAYALTIETVETLLIHFRVSASYR